MRRLPRHLVIAMIAAGVAFVTAPLIFGVSAESVLAGIEWHAAFVSAALWFAFSWLLRNPKLQQWLIVGFFSPFVGVPIFYQMAAWSSGFGLTFPELGPALLLGLAAAGLFSWVLVPVGLLTGGLAAAVSKAFQTIEAK